MAPLIESQVTSDMPYPRSARTLSALLCALLLAACSRIPLPDKDNLPLVYKIDIAQGNVVTQDMLAQLKPGMPKDKVRFIMGTPLIVDTFHDNRWDYIYSFQKGGGERKQRKITLYFEDNALTRVAGDVEPAQEALKVERHNEVTVTVPGEAKPSLMDRVKSSVGLGDKETAPPLKPDTEKPASTEKTATPDEQQADKKTAAAKKQVKSITVPPDTVTEEEEKEQKKGFFGRLLEKMGVGDNEDETEYDPGDPRYKDPTNPDATQPGREP